MKKTIILILILSVVLQLSVNALETDCSEYPNSHYETVTSTNYLNFIPETSCKCNDSYYAVNTSAGFICKNINIKELIPDSIICLNSSISKSWIYKTGYCCKPNYYFNKTIILEDIQSGKEACIRNEKPIIRINQPKSPYVDVGVPITFDARFSSDSDGEIVLYKWDFGIAEKPWGYLERADYQIFCASYILNKSCSINSAKYSGKLDPAVLGNPCTCENNIFSSEIKQTIYPSITFSYDYPYACDYFNLSNKCQVNLTVFDDFNESSSVIINLILNSSSVQSSATEDNLTIVNSTMNVKSSNNTCPQNISDCAPGERFVRAGPGSNCSFMCLALNIPNQTTSSNSSCGNDICERFIGENSQSCIADCHCGDNVCQSFYEETNENCPQDCSKKSSKAIFILLVFVFFAVLFGLFAFLAYKKGWIDSFLDKFGIKQKKKEKDMFNIGPPATESDSSLHSYSEKFPEAGDLAALKSYIQSARASGHSYAQIKKELTENGWDEDTINQAFNELR